MAITPLDIANMALAVLDEAPIDSLDQDVKAARPNWDRTASSVKNMTFIALKTTEA